MLFGAFVVIAVAAVAVLSLVVAGPFAFGVVPSNSPDPDVFASPPSSSLPLLPSPPSSVIAVVDVADAVVDVMVVVVAVAVVSVSVTVVVLVAVCVVVLVAEVTVTVVAVAVVVLVVLVVGMQELHNNGQATLIVAKLQTPSRPAQLSGSALPLQTGVVVVTVVVVVVAVAVEVVVLAVVLVPVDDVSVAVVLVVLVAVVVLVVGMHASHSTGQSAEMPSMPHCFLLSCEHSALS